MNWAPYIGSDRHAYTPPMSRSASSRTPRRCRIPALAMAVAIAAAGGSACVASAATAPNGLSYSTASGRVVQRQPPASSCHARGKGLYSRPDAGCTPGALNPAVTQATLNTTICRGGWTSTVRPAERITRPEKLASMSSYGDGSLTSAFEYDHVVPLELGGAVNDPRNLWPEPGYSVRSGFYLNPKDRLERVLNRLVCSGGMSLAQAQRKIATDWVSAYRRYG